MRFWVKWVFCIGLCCGYFVPTWADQDLTNRLDRVIFLVSAEKWAETSTANVVVEAHLSLNKEDLSEARRKILTHLNAIAKGAWQITQFTRAQESSGLETLYVVAETRVPEASLTEIHAKASKLSTPGATYKIRTIAFEPTHEELDRTEALVRLQIYQKIQSELKALNQLYLDQKYSVYKIRFLNAPLLKSLPYRTEEAAPLMMGGVASMGVKLGNLVQLQAEVVLAATRKERA